MSEISTQVNAPRGYLPKLLSWLEKLVILLLFVSVIIIVSDKLKQHYCNDVGVIGLLEQWLEYKNWMSIWQRDGRLIYLLGTTHGSRVSVGLTRTIIKNVRPTAVFVELDPSRRDASFPTPLPSSNVVLGKKACRVTFVVPERTPLLVRLWNRVQGKTKLIEPLKFQEQAIQYNAAEFELHLRHSEVCQATAEAQKIGAAVVLGDSLSLDNHRFLRRLTAWESRRMIVPRCYDYQKSHSNLCVRMTIAQMKRFPLTFHFFVRLRDKFMATGMDTLAQFDMIVAVMGKGHIEGVEQHLQTMGWKPIARHNVAFKTLMGCQSFVRLRRWWWWWKHDPHHQKR